MITFIVRMRFAPEDRDDIAEILERLTDLSILAGGGGGKMIDSEEDDDNNLPD